MTAQEINSWQSVQDEVLRRINSREWKPGEAIPNEEQLSREFGCARATVNRALRNLADAGLLDRKRRAGTRVALHPVRKATLDIPVIRREIEAKGLAYGYSLISRNLGQPPADVMARMQTNAGEKLLHVVALHLAAGKPYVFENRWINPDAIPAVRDTGFEDCSPNEWLVENVPFQGGDIAFSARAAGSHEAEILDCNPGEALFIIDRSTWTDERIITSVRLTFAPGYRMHTMI